MACPLPRGVIASNGIVFWASSLLRLFILVAGGVAGDFKRTAR